MKKLESKNIDFHATHGMIEKRWGFPRRTLRALLGMTKSGQSGRSMIEMLGVLAIIGVLSVGGIAGYSKAMQKYRINKTIEQTTLIAGNVRAFFAPQKNYIGVSCQGVYCSATNGCKGYAGVNSNGNHTIANNGCPIIKKAKILPDEMITVNTDGKITAITNPFGGGASLSYTNKSTSGDYQAFIIDHDIGDNMEACIELITYDWTNAGVEAINTSGPGGDMLLKMPVDISIAPDFCTQALKNVGYTVIGFLFDIDLNGTYWKSRTDWYQ